jgi:hypothetical protein
MLYAYTETTLNGKISPEGVCVSVDSDTRWRGIRVLSVWAVWEGLSLEAVSRYCPFKYLTIL